MAESLLESPESHGGGGGGGGGGGHHDLHSGSTSPLKSSTSTSGVGGKGGEGNACGGDAAAALGTGGGSGGVVGDPLLHAFLTDIGLAGRLNTEQLLREHEVDFDALCYVTDDDLREIGILKGPRIKIIRQRDAWRKAKLGALGL